MSMRLKSFVEDFMIKEPVAVFSGADLFEVAKMFRNNSFADPNHVPVVDEQDKVIGIISEKEFRNVSTVLAVLSKNDYPTLANLKIIDFAETKLPVLQQKDSVIHAMKVMLQANVTCLAVEDESQKFTGILSYKNLLEAFFAYSSYIDSPAQGKRAFFFPKTPDFTA